MGNYPDDIRKYDNDPRSPFYSEPKTCPVCDGAVELEAYDEDGNGYCDFYCEDTNCEMFNKAQNL